MGVHTDNGNKQPHKVAEAPASGPAAAGPPEVPSWFQYKRETARADVADFGGVESVPPVRATRDPPDRNPQVES